VIPEDKYRIVISNPAWVHAAPANPGAYAATALAAGLSAAHHKQIIAQQKEEQTSYADYLGLKKQGKSSCSMTLATMCSRPSRNNP
jgi:hypothetical protein